MEAFFNILLGLFGLIGVIAVAWCFLIPAGIIVAILKKFNKVKLSWNKIWLIFFGGFGLLIVNFLLVFIVTFISSLLGVHVNSFNLPH